MTPAPPPPSSPVYAHINYVADRVETAVSGGVSNEMLLVGIANLMAQLAVRTNASSGGVLPMDMILNGLSQKLREATPQFLHTVRPMPVPQEPGTAP